MALIDLWNYWTFSVKFFCFPPPLIHQMLYSPHKLQAAALGIGIIRHNYTCLIYLHLFHFLSVLYPPSSLTQPTISSLPLLPGGGGGVMETMLIVTDKQSCIKLKTADAEDTFRRQSFFKIYRLDFSFLFLRKHFWSLLKENSCPAGSQ